MAAVRPARLGSKALCSPESWFLIVKLACVHVQNWEIQKPVKRKDCPTLRTSLGVGSTRHIQAQPTSITVRTANPSLSCPLQDLVPTPSLTSHCPLARPALPPTPHEKVRRPLEACDCADTWNIWGQGASAGWRRKWQPTPVFLPGESQGQGSLVGRRLWGRTESDTNEET